MADTVRELCLAWLKAHFAGQAADAPAGDPYGFAYSLVTRARLDGTADKKRYALGIYDQQEQEEHKVGVTVCKLRVALEFRVWVDTGADPSVVGNWVLGMIKRRLREDITLGNNALRIDTLGSELDIDGPNDHQIQGVVFLLIQYRHHESDPRRKV